MKRKLLWVGAALLATGVAYLQTTTTDRPLAGLIPTGALAYAEARNLNGLLREWNTSAVKSDWLTSANFSVFANSNLYQKLSGVFEQYAAAAGFKPDLAAVIGMAGDRSAIAMYELREVEFLAITRLGERQLLSSRIWAVRDKFQQRRSGKYTFYLRRDPGSGRTVAFAFVEGHLFLATRDDLVARALALLSGAAEPSIAGDAWYRDPVAQRPAAGELRMVLNLEMLVRSTYFRSYWIQRNASAVAQYRAGLADLDRTANQITERRLFLRAGNDRAQPASQADLARLVALVPPAAGLYRGTVSPPAAEVAALIEAKLLAPTPPTSRYGDYSAPYAASMDGTSGSETDLEERIDEAPINPAVAGSVNIGPVQALLTTASPRAVMLVQRSATATGEFWVSTPSLLIASAGASSWNASQLREAFSTAIDSYLTTSRLGVRWAARQTPAGSIETMTGLARLSFAIRGPLLFVANDEALLADSLSRTARPPAAPAGPTYWAGFRHGQERDRYDRLMTALDSAHESPRFGIAGFFRGGEQTPFFFSDNLASLSQTLNFVSEVELQRTDSAASVTEQVMYRLR